MSYQTIEEIHKENTSNINDLKYRTSQLMSLFSGHAKVISEFNAQIAERKVENTKNMIKIAELNVEIKKLKAEIEQLKSS